jgi:hypothetical protein
MFIFLMPLIVAYTALGIAIGIVVGRKLWGPVGAACLGTLLGMAPPLAAWVGLVLLVFPEGGR